MIKEELLGGKPMYQAFFDMHLEKYVIRKVFDDPCSYMRDYIPEVQNKHLPEGRFAGWLRELRRGRLLESTEEAEKVCNKLNKEHNFI